MICQEAFQSTAKKSACTNMPYSAPWLEALITSFRCYHNWFASSAHMSGDFSFFFSCWLCLFPNSFGDLQTTLLSSPNSTFSILFRSKFSRSCRMCSDKKKSFRAPRHILSLFCRCFWDSVEKLKRTNCLMDQACLNKCRFGLIPVWENLFSDGSSLF